MNRVEERKGLDIDVKDIAFDADHDAEHDSEQDAQLTNPIDQGRFRMEEPNHTRSSVESELDIECPRSVRSEMRSGISNGNYEYVNEGDADDLGQGG